VSIIGIGQDLVESGRIRRALARHGRRFLERCYTELEIEYCHRFADPAPELAARFAGKEAAVKALGAGIAQGVRWRDVEILRRPGSPPTLHFHGQALLLARRLRVGRAHVTLTHGRELVSAVVILEQIPA
jgi:holo-[acyl-carrier protein] synthase